MTDRYEVRFNRDTYLYDIYDNVRGDRLFGSFKTEQRALDAVKKRNAQTDLTKLNGFRYVKYDGPTRSVKNSLYRTPKGAKVEGKSGGKCHFFEVRNGLVVVSYV